MTRGEWKRVQRRETAKKGGGGDNTRPNETHALPAAFTWSTNVGDLPMLATQPWTGPPGSLGNRAQPTYTPLTNVADCICASKCGKLAVGTPNFFPPRPYPGATGPCTSNASGRYVTGLCCCPPAPPAVAALTLIAVRVVAAGRPPRRRSNSSGNLKLAVVGRTRRRRRATATVNQAIARR